MAIQIHGTIKPKNNGSFPVAEAADILMPDGSRLDSFSGTAGTALAAISHRVTALEQNSGGGSGEGGVSSWNDLTDKPFYDNSISVEYDLSQAPGIVLEVPDLGASFGKVTDTVLTREQLLNTTLYAIAGADGNEIVIPITEENILISNEDFTLISTNYGVFSVSYRTGTIPFSVDGIEGTMEMPETGTYMAGYTDGEAYAGLIVRFVCNDVRTLDAKFLPMSAIEDKIEDVISAALEGDY